jgi:hypothetical protein
MKDGKGMKTEDGAGLKDVKMRGLIELPKKRHEKQRLLEKGRRNTAFFLALN